MKTFYLLSLFSLFSSVLMGQQIDWQGNAEVLGIFSSEDANPFWLSTNTNTQLGVASNFSGLGNIEGHYQISESASINVGLAYFYRDEVNEEFQRKNAFLQFKNKWLKATIGAKASDRVQQGLSVTNKNFLFSENARPLSGVLLEANRPIQLFKNIALDWGIGHYSLNDDRFVNDVRVHYKRLGIGFKLKDENILRAQIQHYAQWGGTSPVFGELNNDFEAFIDVFFARRTSEIDVEGELLNAVGNHLGSYLLDYYFVTSVGNFSIYHEHPFEDGSGTRLANFPDGVWGAYYEPADKKIFSGILYEFISTENQSKGGVGADNYFSNNIYRSGWTYEGNTLGLPLFLVNPNLEITADNSPIVSNRVVSHHFGFAGVFNRIYWQFKSSLVKNSGTFNNPFPEAINNWYNYLSLQYISEKYGTIRLLAGLDSGKQIETTVGAGLGYSYSF